LDHAKALKGHPHADYAGGIGRVEETFSVFPASDLPRRLIPAISKFMPVCLASLYE
jgi:hypothetical protein